MTTGYYELDKLTFLQRQKYDHLFHVLYDTTNDKTVSRQDFLELLKKVQILRKWPTGCPGHQQAERIIARVWTAFQKGNRKYRNKDSQMHIRDHEWRQYWGDFVEAARAARGWPETSLDEDVNYGWQKDYMNFMFQLMDVNGDGGLDRGEYLKCFTSFGLSPEDCNTAFDKFAVDAYGRPLQEIDIHRFEELWFQYLTSDDLASHPGNYLMGKLDLQQHAPADYYTGNYYQSAPEQNDVRKPKQEQPKIVGVKPSSVTMVYGQLSGGAPRIGDLDEDQIYDPSRRRYQNDPGVDVAGKRGRPNYAGHAGQHPQGGSGGRPAQPSLALGQMGVEYGQHSPARQDSQSKPLQIKVSSVANPSLASPTHHPDINSTPVNYSSSGQVSLRQGQQQQPQRQISATSSCNATAPSIAAFNCTVEDAPTGYSRSRPGQQYGAGNVPAKSTATFNQPSQPSYGQQQAQRSQPSYGQQQPQSYAQTSVLNSQPSSFSKSYGPEKSYTTGPKSQVRGMQPKQPPHRRAAPFAIEPQKQAPPPPGGPRGARPVYSDF